MCVMYHYIRCKWPCNDLKFTLLSNVPAYTMAANEGVLKAIVSFLPRWFRYGPSWWSFLQSTSLKVQILAFSKKKWLDMLDSGKQKCLCDLRNWGPLEMLLIAKLIKTVTPLHQFSNNFWCLVHIVLFKLNFDKKINK